MDPLSTTKININEFSHNEWHFCFTDSFISGSEHLKKIQSTMKLSSVPDCFFENNRVFIINEKQQFGFMVDPKSALHLCNFAEMHSQLINDQLQTNHTIIQPNRIHNTALHANLEYTELDNTSEIFFASPYMGTVFIKQCFPICLKQLQNCLEQSDQIQDPNTKSQQSLQSYEVIYEEVTHSNQKQQYVELTDQDIPIEMLTQDNPILWFQQIILYEDDYGDNGYCKCEFKFRVMDDCFFGLLRTYVRVDNNLVRIYDTRIFHEIGTGYLLRVFEERENTWLQLLNKGFQFKSSWMVDQMQSHEIENYMDIKTIHKEKVHFKQVT